MNEYPTILELVHDGTIDLNACDLPHRVSYQRRVDWRGDGWYSLDDENVYRPGEFATYSRIILAG